MSILEFSASFHDFRQQSKVRHYSTDIIFITAAAVICGAEDWYEIESFAKCKENFFRRHLSLPNGIPSHDTFNRFFALLSPDVLEDKFRTWIRTLCDDKPELVSIDGKTIRGAKEHGNKSIFHMVSAFCHANGVCLGQVRTDERSNEITAIPELIKTLDLRDCIVSIDAVACQTRICESIVRSGADFILAVKNNQKELYESVEDTFRFSKTEFSVDEDCGHGRIEKRVCRVSNDVSMIDKKWKDVKSLIKIESQRYDKSRKKQEKSTRYYISSKILDCEHFNRLVREHWAIENNLHWHLDVSFGEDRSRKRIENSPQNFSAIFKIALTLLKEFNPPKKSSIKTKRKMAGWSDEVLWEILKG